MKQILFAAVLFLTSCASDEPKKTIPNKYKKYDVVYLLPDSTKVVILDTATWDTDLRYQVGLRTLYGYKFYNISEEMIISK